MSECNHKTLTLLKQRSDRLRCRHCHLVISADELGKGDCPECHAVNGVRQRDFEEVAAQEDGATTYRCDQCGAVIEWNGQS